MCWARIKANDDVDPFIAVYEPLTPSCVQNVLTMSITGFIVPFLVQDIIENCDIASVCLIKNTPCRVNGKYYLSLQENDYVIVKNDQGTMNYQFTSQSHKI
jgi:hypothetical protein